MPREQRGGRPGGEKRDEAENGELIGGLNAVLAALKARPQSLRRLLVAEGRHGNSALDEIFNLARGAGAGVKIVPRRQLTLQYGRPEHQGVLAVFDSKDYALFDDFLAGLPKEGPALVLALDKVADPQNLGALMRAAEIFGAAGLITPRDNAAALTPAALKASAGAAEYLPLCRVVNLARALESLKQAGFWAVGAEGSGEDDLSDFRFPERTVLVLGSEGKGLSPLIYKLCDFRVRIPQARGRISSLNVAASGAIFLFEYLRQLKTVV